MQIINFKDISLHSKDIIMDIREQNEVLLEKCMLQNTVNMPLSELNSSAINTLKNVQGNIYILCKAGVRSCKAYEILTPLFNNIYIIDGGINNIDKQYIYKKNRFTLAQQTFIVIGFINLICVLGNIYMDNRFIYGILFTALGMIYAGLSGNCLLEKILKYAPWNKQ